jgi:hypothetical protein
MSNTLTKKITNVATPLPECAVRENKNFEDEKNKSEHICGEESCILLIIQIYKIHNSRTCLPPSSTSMLKEKSNFRDYVVHRFPEP